MTTKSPPRRVESVLLEGVAVPYTVRRSERAKNIRITISAHDGVVVTLPLRQSYYVNPEKFLREKAQWVLRHLSTISLPPAVTALRSGSVILYRGRNHRLRLSRGVGELPRVVVDGDVIRISLPYQASDSIETALRTWFSEQARRMIERTVDQEAVRIGVNYTRLTIRDQKTKWGSCSKSGGLSFNWRLILFPPSVLRYVVVHELCHIKHFNHSERFWRLVAHHDKSYETSVEWLKTNGARMGNTYR
jgi:predicted metal-dependent hydrolase